MSDQHVVWELEFIAPGLPGIQSQIDAVSASADQLGGHYQALAEIIQRAGSQSTPAVHELSETHMILSETVQTSQEALMSFGEGLGEIAGVRIPSFISGLSLTEVGVAGVVTALAAGTAALTVFGAEWQHAVSNLTVQADQSREAVGEISAAMQGLAGQVPQTAMALTESLTSVIGQLETYRGEALSAQQATELMTAASNLAVSTGQSLEASTQAITSQIMASRGGFEDASKTADLLSNAYRMTGVSSEEFATAVGRLQARLGDAAPSGEQLATVLAILEQSGLRGQRAMMLIYQAIEGLENPSASATHALETLGVEVKHTADGQMDIVETIGELREALNSISDPAQRHAAEVDLLGKNYGLLEDLIRPSAEEVATLAEKMGEHNTASERAEQHAKDLKEHLVALGAQAQTAAGQIGNELAKTLVELGTDFDYVGTAISRLPDHLPAWMTWHPQTIQESANQAGLQGGAPGSPEWDAAMAAMATSGGSAGNPHGSPDVTSGTTTSHVGPEGYGYESEAGAKKRAEREKIAADYEREQGVAALQSQQEARRESERMAEQVGRYVDKYGEGVELGGRAADDLARQNDLRDRQFDAQTQITAATREHEDSLRDQKQDYEDIDRATKQQREDADYLKTTAREDAAERTRLSRQGEDDRRADLRQTSDYARQLVSQDADYQVQEIRRAEHERLADTRSDRDSVIGLQRAREDAEREHQDRLKEIRAQGGANVAGQIERENENYEKQMENLQRNESRRQQDVARHRSDQQQDDALAQQYHAADVARQGERADITRSLAQSRRGEDEGIRGERAAIDLGIQRGYHAEDTGEHRGNEVDDITESRRRAQELLDTTRAWEDMMKPGSGGIRDQIEGALGILPDQIARANAERQRSLDYLSLSRDLAREQHDFMERIVTAIDRQNTLRARALQQYATHGGSEADFPDMVTPSSPSRPGLPAAPESSPGIHVGEINVNAPIIGNLGSDQAAVAAKVASLSGSAAQQLAAVTGGY